MTHYVDNDYIERYFVRFVDVEGSQWRISIQAPFFNGTATELTGAEFPIEWEGEGDESQTDVVLGSTGNLRLICLEGQESIFSIGNIMPSMINDRRVQVMRENRIIWQGFIKPETYMQEWDSTPYEIELPIVSMIAASEYFYMPDYSDVEQVNTIRELLRYVISLCGCSVDYLITNNPIYRDFLGNTQYITIGGQSVPAQWIEGYATSHYFYDEKNGEMQPKTIRDVFELICSPYGKLHEYGRNIFILMRGDLSGIADGKEWYLDMNDYSQTRFYENHRVFEIGLSDIITSGTDNTQSIIAKPESLSFESSPDIDTDIFKLSSDMITGIDGSTAAPSYWYGQPASGITRYIFDIPYGNIKPNVITRSNASNNYLCFCRVVEADGTENVKIDNDHVKTKLSVTSPLAFMLHQGHQVGIFKLEKGLRTRAGYNKIELKITSNRALDNGGDGDIDKIALKIYDITTDRYYSISKNLWFDINGYTPDTGEYDLDNPTVLISSNSATITFALAGDMDEEHYLEFTVVAAGADSNSHYFTIEMKYIAIDELIVPPDIKNSTPYKIFLNDLVKYGRSSKYGGSGDEISINFKTMAGIKSRVINGSVDLPYNSFCDAQSFIDISNRKKIEIKAAKFKSYRYSNHIFDLVTSYALIKDVNEGITYIPVAVGMNPRMNTISLMLVSTNISA